MGAEGRQLADDTARGQKFDMAADLGRRLVEAIRRRRTFPEQEAERRAFTERMKHLVIARREEWPFEYENWKSRGLL
jgi:hypothetical protein